jgi:hypothetical protein
MSISRRSGWSSSGRVILVVCLAGAVSSGILAAWISPYRAMGAGESLMRFLRGLGFPGAVLYVALQICVAVSGILPASLLLAVAAGAIYGLVPAFCWRRAVLWREPYCPFAVSARNRISGGPPPAIAQSRYVGNARWLEAGVPAASLAGPAPLPHQFRTRPLPDQLA